MFTTGKRDISMMQAITILSAIVGFAFAAAHAEDARQLTCTGQIIEPKALEQSPMTVRLRVGPARNIAVDLGQGMVNAHTTSNNKILLRFRIENIEGEYFRYTDDLFLIYKSGHLARLMCRQDRP
jgi:hypothetical protein